MCGLIALVKFTAEAQRLAESGPPDWALWALDGAWAGLAVTENCWRLFAGPKVSTACNLNIFMITSNFLDKPPTALLWPAR